MLVVLMLAGQFRQLSLVGGLDVAEQSAALKRLLRLFNLLAPPGGLVVSAQCNDPFLE